MNLFKKILQLVCDDIRKASCSPVGSSKNTMKDISVVVEMLRDHNVTAEVKFKKLLKKT